MISIRIVPERQRFALLRDDGFSRLLGPGVVFTLRLPGRRYVLLSIGDSCQLTAHDQGRFGEELLPVELIGPSTSSAARVTGFRSDAILVAGEDSEAPGIENEAAPTRRAALRYTRRAFWVGLPVILLFAVVTWLGALYAADQILTEQKVYQRGVLVAGTVEEKILYRQTDAGEQAHYVVYNFRAPADFTIRNKIRIESAAWHQLKENGPIAIRYVPNKPELNLPDGWHMQNFYCLAGGIALAGALFFTVVLVGMVIKKISGGYE